MIASWSDKIMSSIVTVSAYTKIHLWMSALSCAVMHQLLGTEKNYKTIEAGNMSVTTVWLNMHKFSSRKFPLAWLFFFMNNLNSTTHSFISPS